MAYLTAQQAADRLQTRYGYEGVTLAEGDVEAASDALDSLAPFKGERPDGQERQFPRDGEDAVPDAVLDWVALRAYQLSTDEEPAVIREGAGRVSVTYAYPKLPQSARRMARLIQPYLVRTGRRS